MEFVIDNNKDKECEVLSALFIEITTDMKSTIPNFEELISRAGKLHSSLKHTISSLSSFLDIFERIGEIATNTTGGLSDIGLCINKILLKQRTLESRMKSIAVSLIDCLMNPLQAQSEEWKRNLNTIEKEHLKANKKNRRNIKKKSEEVLRLKKKLKKEKYSDPRIKRLLDESLKDLNVHFRDYSTVEKLSVQRALSENRGRFMTFLSLLKPLVREEVVLARDFMSLDGILRDSDLSPCSLDVLIESLIKESLKNNDAEDHYSLHLPTPPSSPRCRMASQQEYMSTNLIRKQESNISRRQSNRTPFIEPRANGGLYSVTNYDPRFRRPSSSISLHEPSSHRSPGEYNRPWSTAFWNFNQEYRRQFSMPESPSSMRHSASEGQVDDDSEDEFRLSGETYSTIKRSCNPIYRPSDVGGLPYVKSVSIPRRCSSADRSLPPLHHLNRQFIPCLSGDKASATNSSPPHYDTPKPLLDLQHVPNFNSYKGDMVIPHPIYLESKDQDSEQSLEVKAQDSKIMINPNIYIQNLAQKQEDNSKISSDGHKPHREQSTSTLTEEGSSNSSDSVYSSSGYGSQFGINGQCRIEDPHGVNPLVPTKKTRPVPPLRHSSISDKSSMERESMATSIVMRDELKTIDNISNNSKGSNIMVNEGDKKHFSAFNSNKN